MITTDVILDNDASDFHRYCADELLKRIYERHVLVIAKIALQRDIPIYVIPFDLGTRDLVANWLSKFEKDQLAKAGK